MSTAQQCRPFVTFFVTCSNPVEPGLTGFKQLINFVSSSWFPAKSVDQLIVEQSNFEQLIPTRLNFQDLEYIFGSLSLHPLLIWRECTKQLQTRLRLFLLLNSFAFSGRFFHSKEVWFLQPTLQRNLPAKFHPNLLKL